MATSQDSLREEDVKYLLANLESIQGDVEDKLVLLAKPLNKMATELVNKNHKIITSLENKLLRLMANEQGKTDDALKFMEVTALQGLNQWQDTVHYTLDQLATRGGIKEINQPLEDLIIKETTDAPLIAYGATLVLAVREAVPYFEQLIKVLREIRDRMPPREVMDKGESGRAEAGEEVTDSPLPLPDFKDTPISWDEV